MILDRPEPLFWALSRFYCPAKPQLECQDSGLEPPGQGLAQTSRPIYYPALARLHHYYDHSESRLNMSCVMNAQTWLNKQMDCLHCCGSHEKTLGRSFSKSCWIKHGFDFRYHRQSPDRLMNHKHIWYRSHKRNYSLLFAKGQAPRAFCHVCETFYTITQFQNPISLSETIKWLVVSRHSGCKARRNFEEVMAWRRKRLIEFSLPSV